jgi:Flp pilus assembly protein TadG
MGGNLRRHQRPIGVGHGRAGPGDTRNVSRTRAHREDGAAAVEFAIVATLFFMLVFAIIDFGFGFHTWNATANAAREGARRAAVSPDVGEIEARVRQAADFLDQSKMSVSVTCSRSGGSYGPCPTPSAWVEGDSVRVTVDYAYPFITPLPSFVGLGDELTLHSVSESRFEGL